MGCYIEDTAGTALEILVTAPFTAPLMEPAIAPPAAAFPRSTHGGPHVLPHSSGALQVTHINMRDEDRM